MSKELSSQLALKVSDPAALEKTADPAVLERNLQLAQATLEATQRYQAIQDALGHKKGLRAFGLVLASSQRATDGFLAHQLSIKKRAAKSAPRPHEKGLKRLFGEILFRDTRKNEEPSRLPTTQDEALHFDGTNVRRAIFQIRTMRAIRNGSEYEAPIPPLTTINSIIATYEGMATNEGLRLLNPEPDPNLESDDPDILEQALMKRALQVMHFADDDHNFFYKLKAQLESPQVTSNSEAD